MFALVQIIVLPVGKEEIDSDGVAQRILFGKSLDAEAGPPLVAAVGYVGLVKVQLAVLPEGQEDVTMLAGLGGRTAANVAHQRLAKHHIAAAYVADQPVKPFPFGGRGTTWGIRVNHGQRVKLDRVCHPPNDWLVSHFQWG